MSPASKLCLASHPHSAQARWKLGRTRTKHWPSLCCASPRRQCAWIPLSSDFRGVWHIEEFLRISSRQRFSPTQPNNIYKDEYCNKSKIIGYLAISCGHCIDLALKPSGKWPRCLFSILLALLLHLIESSIIGLKKGVQRAGISQISMLSHSTNKFFQRASAAFYKLWSKAPNCLFLRKRGNNSSRINKAQLIMKPNEIIESS